ncbi:hypothetical protein [Methanolobus psychrotolerans]|uniref:hypothetical protein n=1 Tax=Methanolobus psychrotolerans TaxID=1874706 RepID=UPI000B91C21B|nr:hypothetical protein [Methanolobus psychrotolerans]
MNRTLSNTVASRNGRSMEQSILHYMGLQHEGQPVDSSLQGHPLEIKSCQTNIIDSYNSNGRRSGRFVFDSEQLSYLTSNDGFFVFIVHEDLVVHHTWMMKAGLVRLHEFDGVRSVPWTTVRRWLN